MLQIKERKINNFKIQPMKPLETLNPKDILGYDLFPTISGTIFIYSAPRSGKTTLIKNILDNCIDDRTKLYVFCSTVYSETSGGWDEIFENLDKKEIDYEVYDSIYTIEENSQIQRNGAEKIVKKKIDDLNDIYNTIKKTRKSDNTKDKGYCKLADNDVDLFVKLNESSLNIEVKKKKKRKKSADYCFVFDDIAGQIKNNSTLESLFREYRHTHIKLIIASQTILDIPADCRKIVQYHILLSGVPDDHLNYAYNAMSPKKINFKQFVKIYKYCTTEKYNFLMYNKENGEFRKNYDTIIDFDVIEDDSDNDIVVI